MKQLFQSHRTGIVYIPKAEPRVCDGEWERAYILDSYLRCSGWSHWGSGQPFIFLSLGPTVFVPAFDRQSDRTRNRRIIGSHITGGVAGLLAWTVLASGAPITATPPRFLSDGF